MNNSFETELNDLPEKYREAILSGPPEYAGQYRQIMDSEGVSLKEAIVIAADRMEANTERVEARIQFLTIERETYARLITGDPEATWNRIVEASKSGPLYPPIESVESDSYLAEFLDDVRDRDIAMVMEFAARLPNEPTETVIIEDLVRRYHREESTIRLAITRLAPQAQAAVARIRAEYREYKQSMTGENT